MWQCLKCREQIEDSFTVCWKCGTAQDGTEDPNFRPLAEEEANTPAPAAAAPEESPAAADALSREEKLAAFRLALTAITPRVVVTPLLLAANVLVFVIMVAAGVHALQPTIEQLIGWGADFGPLTVGGDWWRLLTSMFVHIGVIHIALNMWALADAGPLVERMLGNTGFLLTYLLSGLCGSLASVLWNPLVVSAGASGAIFGIYGALLGLLLGQRRTIPAEALAGLRNSGIGFLAYNLLIGMTQANVDNAAHLGGLAGGFLCGLVLGQPLTVEALTRRAIRNLVLAVFGTVFIGGGMFAVYSRHGGFAEVQGALTRFENTEKKSLAVLAALRVMATIEGRRFENTEKKSLDAFNAFAEVLERDVLPPWRASRKELASFNNVPAALQRHVTAVVDYMRLRQEAWELMLEAAREMSQQKMQQAVEKQKQADAAAQGLRQRGGK